MSHRFHDDGCSKPTVWIIGGEGVQLRIPLLRRLQQHGFRMAAAGSDDRPEFETCGFPYVRYPLSRSVDPLSDRRTRRELTRLFARHRPDLVHAVNTKPAILVPLAAKRVSGTVCVRTITGLGSVFSSSSASALMLRPIYHLVQRRASAASAVTVFQNGDDRDYFLRNKLVPPGRDRLVLSSGIDVDGFRGTCGDDRTLSELKRELNVQEQIVVTMVSRLFRAKGVAEFLQAAALVRRQRTDVTCLLAGPLVTTGPMSLTPDLLEHRPENLRYLGFRYDVANLLAISDVFVLPSYLREGVPRVLLEAGAMGLPLITTDVPGCREVVRNEWNGLLVPARDAATLAQAILQLADSKPRRALMGQRSQALVRDTFDLAKVAHAYAEIYREALRLPSTAEVSNRRAA